MCCYIIYVYETFQKFYQMPFHVLAEYSVTAQGPIRPFLITHSYVWYLSLSTDFRLGRR